MENKYIATVQLATVDGVLRYANAPYSFTILQFYSFTVFQLSTAVGFGPLILHNLSDRAGGLTHK